MNPCEAFRITREQARAFLVELHFSGQEDPDQQPSLEERLLSVVRKLGCIQYDPLDSVGRNHDLVLQSRIESYHPGDLERCMYGMKERLLVDGLDKQLSVFLVEDWPCLDRMRRRLYDLYGRQSAVQAVLPAVLERLKREGPLRAEDFSLEQKIRWPWGEARLSRAALETLWYGGEAILHHREGARRFYAATEQLLPSAILRQPPAFSDDADYFSWHTLRRIRGIGLVRSMAGDAWLGIHDFTANRRQAAFDQLRERGEIVPVHIHGLPYDKPYYMVAANKPIMDAVIAGHRNRDTVRFLAPLDNLLWDRRMIREIFGFSYTWEVYTPVVKRQYGYYVLPVLYGDRLIARFEPERYRPGDALRVKAWWWEKDVRPDSVLFEKVEEAVLAFAGYLRATEWYMDCDWKIS